MGGSRPSRSVDLAPHMLIMVVCCAGRNAGTEAGVWMTVRGEMGSLPLVYLNGNSQSASVRLVSPLIIEMVLTTKAKRQQLLADGSVGQAIVKAVAETARVAHKFVEVFKVDEMVEHAGAYSRARIRVQVVLGCRQDAVMLC